MTLSDIKLAVRDLPVHVQEALNLSIAGHTTKAIAESLGISESTAARRLEEARDILRPQLLGARNEATTDDVVDPQWESVTTREPAADEPAPVLADSPRRDGPQHVR